MFETTENIIRKKDKKFDTILTISIKCFESDFATVSFVQNLFYKQLQNIVHYSSISETWTFINMSHMVDYVP